MTAPREESAAARRRIRLRALVVGILRESRAARGRLFFFVACLAVGVAAVVGVSALVGAMRAGLREEARDLLAGDLRLSARQPLPPELDAFFADVPHARTDLRELAAMASVAGQSGDGSGGPGESRLVELKVVDGEYPFYGELVVHPAGVGVGDLGSEAVLVAPELARGLGLSAGDELSLGGARFRVAGQIESEPDQVEFALTLGPRVLVTAAGFARTSLVGSLNRVRYRALYRLEGQPARAEVRALGERLEDELGEHSTVHVRTYGDPQPRFGRSLRRVEEYLGLVALLSLLLGGIGVSQIVRAWLAGRAQTVAVLRSVGYRAREIAALYLGHVALLALAGSLVGGALGAGLPWVVRAAAPELFQGGGASLWQPQALARGVGLGLLVALLFSLPPLTAVWRVPPAAVLRSEAVPLAAPRSVRFGAPLVLFLGVLASARVQSGEWLPALSFSVGLVLLAGLLGLGARAATALSGHLPRGRLGPYLEHGFAALARPGAGTTGAIVALGLGVMVVVSMLLVERRLSEALRSALPEDAPSVFLVDVQPDQWAGVRGALEARGADPVDSVPVVMARLSAVDGTTIADLLADPEEDRRRSDWGLTREQRLTWLAELPRSNELVAGGGETGELWSRAGVDEVSLEADFADDIGVGLGTRLTFDVQGIPVEVVVTSLREVDWQSFEINFFVVVEPGVLEAAPHFRIAAARLEPVEAEYALQNEVAAAFPNVTLVRVRPILEKVAGVLERLGFGIRALGSFTMVTGLVILAGAVATTALRRAREAALLKTLGVTRGGVSRLFAVEYALGGLVAGAIGAVGALALAWAFLEELVDLETDLPLAAVPLSALAAALLATLSGLAASARALRARPIETLRG